MTSTLLQWFRENGRTLPWRETRDPYAVWLSEIILQQTRIEQGRPYWERFMQRWPTVSDLAAASEDEVLREWQGLGYYSRARNLHTAARQIIERGAFPDTLEGIRSLKGVGDYTAAAIGSIAFGLPAAVVDGNVFRVLSRYYGIDTPINTAKGKKEFTILAQSLLPEREASAFNQAMMDFGAIQCVPANPCCADCPLQDGCVALYEGRVHTLPVKLHTLKVKERHLIYIYIRCNGQTAIRRRPAGDIWQGLWEPLCIEEGDKGLEAREMLNAIGITCPHNTLPTLLKKHVKHVLTHRVIYADFWVWETDKRPTLPSNYRWIAEDDIDQYAVPRLIEKLLESLPSNTKIT